MAVALGEGDVKTVEDLAGLVPDDLRGWFETKDGERVREPGILETFNLSPEDAEALIMRARVAMGWIEPEPEVEEELSRGRARPRRRSRSAKTSRQDGLSACSTSRQARRHDPRRGRTASGATSSPAR